MRHKIKTDRFGRFSTYRKATIKSLVISVLINQKIVTTKAKAKSARRLVEKAITLGKKNTLAAKRRAFSILCDHRLVKKLFDQIAPLFNNRVGGYTRIIPYRHQRGDNAKLVILELTETLKKEKAEKKVKEAKKSKEAEIIKEEPKLTEKEQIAQAQAEAKQVQEPKKDKPARAEVKQKHEEEAPEQPQQLPAKPEKEEKKVEDKKPEKKEPKKLFGGFKGLFRKKKPQ